MIIGLVILLLGLGLRFYLSYEEYHQKKLTKRIAMDHIGMAQSTGGVEIQSDSFGVFTNDAGRLAVLSDGIGKENTGRVSSQIAVEAFFSLFEQYKSLNNPAYFLKRGFYAANENIRQALGDRRGGASIVAAFLDRNQLCYALAGDAKAALLRNGELIPLSEGHTVDVLAQQAYKQGKITRQEAICSLKEDRLWNYVGVDGFKNIEIFDAPIQLNKGDIVVLMTKGVYKVLSWVEIEEILSNAGCSAKEKADQLIMALDQTDTTERDNGSVIVLETNGWN